MSIECLTVNRNCVIWRNIQLPHPNKKLTSPVFSLDGSKWHFNVNCSWREFEVERFGSREIKRFDSRLNSYLPSAEEEWYFSTTCSDCIKYVIIPYAERNGRYENIAPTIKNAEISRSSLSNFFESDKDTVTMLFLFSRCSLNIGLNFQGTPFEISGENDSGKDLIQSPCLEGLCEDIGQLFNKNEYVDVTLKCGDKSFSVHKIILTARSEVFSAMFKHDMSERNSGIVDIVDLDPDILEQFLRYLYTGKVEQMSMKTALELYLAATKYSVPTLKQLCVSYILQNISKDNIFDVLLLADKAGDMELFDNISSIAARIEEFLKSAEWKDFAEKNQSVALKVYFKLHN